MIITHRDMQQLKYCNPGARIFFSRHGLDWSEFVRKGIQSTVLEATGDAMAIRLVEYVKERDHGVRQE